MDKTFIMTINETSDLLERDQPVQGVVPHPVPFTTYLSIPVKREEVTEVILKHLKDYYHREFRVIPDDYGLPVSINYSGGKFKSMILKGTGEEGERVNDAIALKIVPAESKSQKDITLHALITIQTDLKYLRGGIENHEVPRFLREALRNGFEPYEDKGIVYRVLKVFVDGKRQPSSESVWKLVGNMVITGYYLEYNYRDLEKFIQKEMISEGYSLPQRGLMIEDEHPEEEGAFPETHFIFDSEIIIEIAT